MLNKFKRVLPLVAVVCAVSIVVCLSLLSYQRRSMLTDTGEARQAVEATLTRLQGLRPASLDDGAFRRAVEQATRAPYMVAVWLFAPDGRIVYSAGSTARSTAPYDTVEEAATNDMRRVLDALPQGELSDHQQVLLLVGSAIRREGTHNDIYRHLVRPIQKPDGSVAALVGVAYNVSEDAAGWFWKTSVVAVLVGLAVYWLSLPLWVLLDAKDRAERAWAWATFVFIGNLVALIGYVLARAPEPPKRK